jgi:N-succinyldiaminopimelate aminotransferase
MRADFAAARDDLAGLVAAAGYRLLPAEATYFMDVDLAASGIELDDLSFCERAVRECGVAVIPVSALYAEAPVRTVVRLCFAKRKATRDAGAAALARAHALMAS